MVELAKVSSNGQITVPIGIRQLLGLQSGDKVLFFQNADGDVVLSNASVSALREAQVAFAGASEELGVKDESDVQRLVDEVRHNEE